MDLETENRIAAILMREAADLRRQADKEGLGVYLRDPKARGRPNSRFLTATVLGVQQANKAVEVNEMWRVRQKEKELDKMIKKRTRGEGQSERSHSSSRSYIVEEKANRDSLSMSRNTREEFSSRDGEGLKDEEIDEFLRARIKRGRGGIGSKMDEPGPYLPPMADLDPSFETKFRERWESRILGPEKPPLLISNNEFVFEHGERTKSDKASSQKSSKHAKKHKLQLKEKKSKHKEKKKREKKKRSKHID